MNRGDDDAGTWRPPRRDRPLSRTRPAWKKVRRHYLNHDHAEENCSVWRLLGQRLEAIMGADLYCFSNERPSNLSQTSCREAQ